MSGIFETMLGGMLGGTGNPPQAGKLADYYTRSQLNSQLRNTQQDLYASQSIKGWGIANRGPLTATEAQQMLDQLQERQAAQRRAITEAMMRNMLDDLAVATANQRASDGIEPVPSDPPQPPQPKIPLPPENPWTRKLSP